ncbi:MAG TPA: metalloregulator ArsR/SmtB family transcription factor [Anaeromyxobacter sp.]|nr:metalloregulator ArsR/SmtB family transcription factor [Anaeromyxobacter sp.]
MAHVFRESAVIRVARALGDPTRFRLLKAISARAEVSCAELTALARLAQATVSHHLKVLSDAGLVSVRKDGAFHYYRFRPGVLEAHGAALGAVFAGASRRAARAGRAA